jgi:DNA-binding GntR family transcriptional regulator
MRDLGGLEASSDDRQADGGEALREQIYQRLCESLRRGLFAPGEKITIRQIAEAEGTSPTPVREALYRLVADGALVAEANRSARVPLLTGAEIRELRDIRATVEGLAAARAAEVRDASLVTELRSIGLQLRQARDQGDYETDLRCVYEFQFGLYRACAMPDLIRIIEGLWLRTGPYLTLLYPDYVERVMSLRGDWRERVSAGLDRHDAAAVRDEIERDIRETLTYLADIVDASHLLRTAGSRRRTTATRLSAEPAGRAPRTAGAANLSRPSKRG